MNMNCESMLRVCMNRIAPLAVAGFFICGAGVAQTAPQGARQTSHQKPMQAVAGKAAAKDARPKLVVLLVVDQMRGDYLDKFLGQWRGGLKRLAEEGAWFH